MRRWLPVLDWCVYTVVNWILPHCLYIRVGGVEEIPLLDQSASEPISDLTRLCMGVWTGVLVLFFEPKLVVAPLGRESERVVPHEYGTLKRAWCERRRRNRRRVVRQWRKQRRRKLGWS
jgi:hypothetical protein